jgi:hypothetical protein
MMHPLFKLHNIGGGSFYSAPYLEHAVLHDSSLPVFTKTHPVGKLHLLFTLANRHKSIFIVLSKLEFTMVGL